MENILLFHIGFPKTGSSSLQRFLFENTEKLKKYGWCYPNFSKVAELNLYTYINGYYLRFPTTESDRTKMWKKIEDDLKENNVIISDEAFSYISFDEVLTNAMKIHNNIKVIAYLRRQDQFVSSYYNQKVKAVHVSGTAREYRENILCGLDNYLEVLENISNYIGVENIIVRVYEKQQLEGSRKDTISDFMTTIMDGKEPDWKTLKMPERMNEALHGNFFEIKKILNSVEDEPMKPWGFEYMDSLVGLSDKYGGAYKNAVIEGYLDRQERIDILKDHYENNAEIAKRYLNRQDGRLFYDNNVDVPVYKEKATLFEADMIRTFSILFHVLNNKVELLPLVTAIKMLRGDRRLIVYGVGQQGKKLLDYPLYADILVDNGLCKKKESIMTIPIVSAEDIADWMSCFVVVTMNKCEEVETELQEKGLRKGKEYILMKDYS